MAKGKSNVINKKSRSSKPYDVSNSFVRQVTSRVSNLLPRLPSWFTTHRPDEEEVASSDDEDDEVEESPAPPPTKRARSDLNQPLAALSREHSLLRHTLALENHQDERALLGFVDGRVAGPSGISQRPDLVSSTPAVRMTPLVTNTCRPTEQLTNGDNHSHRSDSSMSTSGCSSLVPQGKHQAERTNITNRTAQRSSVCDRDGSSFVHSTRSAVPGSPYSASPRPGSAQSKRPSFNASVFSNPLSPSQGSLSTGERVPLSPFYAGRTQYGGAAAYRKPRQGLFSPGEAPQPLAVRGVQMKPVNRTNVADMNSSVARRIMDTLDHLSSPVLDAKRIPVAALPALSDSRKRPAPPLSPPPRLGGPPTHDLTIPTVPDLLRLQRRAKMQDSMEAARRVASSMASTDGLSEMEREYRTRLDSGQSRSAGKMTSRMRDLEQEMCEEVNLPNIALPISTLPSFDFVAAKPPSRPKYTFSKPTPLDAAEFLSPQSSLNNFSFVGSKKRIAGSFGGSDSGVTSSLSVHSKVNNTPNFIPYCPSKSDSTLCKPMLKEKSSPVAVSRSNGPNGRVNFGVSVAGELKVGSVMDFLGKTGVAVQSAPSPKPSASTLGDVEKPAAGSWACSVCKVPNKCEANTCQSCTTPRVTKPTATPAGTATVFGFGDQFKKPVGAWDCTDCMTSNAAESTSCVCCTKAKPAPKAEAKLPTIAAGFGSQFKPAVGEWECSACMVRNKKEASTCVSCTTPKPGAKAETKVQPVASGFGSHFKPANNTWECGTCMLRTSTDLDICSVCQAKRPGVTENQKPVKPAVTSGFGDMFKKTEGSWDCPSCMIRNVNVGKCVACEHLKPGTEVAEKVATLPASSVKFNFEIPPEASSFKFGVDKAEVVAKKPEPTSAPSFIFGSSSQVASEANTFMFGIPANPTISNASPASSKPVTSVTPSQQATTPSAPFMFGAATGAPFGTTSAAPTLGTNAVDRKLRVDDGAVESPSSKVSSFVLPKEAASKLFSVTDTTKTSPSFMLPTTTSVSAVQFNGPNTVVQTTETTSSAIPTTTVPTNIFAFGSFNSKPGSTFPSTVQTLTSPFSEPGKPLPSLFEFGSTSSRQNNVGDPSTKKLMFGAASVAPKEVGFGGLVSSAPSFTGASSVTAPNVATPSFGDGASKIATPSFASATTTPSFGSFGSAIGNGGKPAPTSETTASAPFLFGSSMSKPSAPVFSSSKETTPSFGGAMAAPKAAGYSFGSQNVMSNAEAAKPSAGMFNFNAAAAAPKPVATFGFGGGSSAAATFGTAAPSPSPVFGASAAPTFGGLPTAPGAAAGFSFGASATPFGFGGARVVQQAAAPATPAFSFGQTAPFNPNVRPTFNFTGGETPNFTAAGAGSMAGAAPPRRIIKKAMRRAPR